MFENVVSAVNVHLKNCMYKSPVVQISLAPWLLFSKLLLKLLPMLWMCVSVWQVEIVLVTCCFSTLLHYQWHFGFLLRSVVPLADVHLLQPRLLTCPVGGTC